MLSQKEMQRQVVAYAFEATRNNALEEAATLVEKLEDERRPLFMAARLIRELKRDPSLKMTDWWADTPPSIDFVPIGA